MSRINHLAVLVAAIAYYAWGALYFTIFANKWLALLGHPLQATGMSAYIMSFLMALLFGYGTAIALGKSGDSSSKDGVQFAIFMCIVFYASTVLTMTVFEQRALGLWAFDTVYVLVGMCIVGAIVGGWRRKA